MLLPMLHMVVHEHRLPHMTSSLLFCVCNSVHDTPPNVRNMPLALRRCLTLPLLVRVGVGFQFVGWIFPFCFAFPLEHNKVRCASGFC